MCGSIIDIKSATAEIGEENRRRKKEENRNHSCKISCLHLLKMTKSESSVIPFLVPCRKVWLTPTVRVPFSNAANRPMGRAVPRARAARA